MKDKTVKDIVANARDQVTELSAIEFRMRCEEEFSVIIDVREPAEFEAGHIPRAVNIPRGLLEFMVDDSEGPHSGRNSSIVIYCKSGGRSALATLALKRMGYKRIAHLEKGYDDWVIATARHNGEFL
tara:strand:+ start:797 stop:1177 length:381 start_codon:yes stop_codon:yes gene_type:complete